METCEIGCETSFLSARFVAVAKVADGTERIYEPERARIAVDHLARPIKDDEKTIASHQRLVDLLIQNGWERVGRNNHWWEDQFERESPRRARSKNVTAAL